MATDLTPADPQPVFELLESFRRSKVMFAGVSLGVFDALAAGDQTAAQIAQSLKCDPSAMVRLLDNLVGLALLTRRGDQYSLTPTASEYLTGESPTGLTGYIQYSNRVMWPMWGNLEDAIREGTHRWKQTYGWDEPIFSSFFKTEAARREFLMGMHGYGTITSPQIVSAIDLGRFHRLVDLGGATGHLVIAACQRYPELRGTLFDLPDVVGLASEIIGAANMGDRIEIVSGDFFTDPLPASDLYALGRIVHDWSEEKIQVLLRKIYDALPIGGGVLICEKMLSDAKDGPRWAQLQDLNMLIVTEGRERTLSEYGELLQAAGFGSIVGRRTPAPLDLILATKA